MADLKQEGPPQQKNQMAVPPIKIAVCAKPRA